MSTRRLSLAAIALAATFMTIVAAPSHAGANLLPNGGFEESAIEPVPQLAGRQPQPLLPTGWAFEGAAGLFDHSPHGGSGGSPRAAGISVPMGGKRSICGPAPVNCNDNPANGPKDTVSKTYSVNPAWRNAQPVKVASGATYTLAFDLSWNLATEGEGAFGAVRWLNSTGTVISVSTPIVVRATASTSVFRDWGRLSAPVVAPAGASTAVVLLGATDDIFISQILFDNAFFG